MFQHRYPELTDMAGVPAGQMAPIETLLPRMRLAQLLDLARAYELKVNLNGTKQRVMPIIQAAAEEGVFRRQPKHPYYLSRAYYSSDDVKDAKGKMGDPESGQVLDDRQIPTQIKPWHGPLPESETRAAAPRAQAARPTSEPDAVKARARELGIKTQGKTLKGLKASITYHERKQNEAANATGDQDVAEAAEPAT